MAVSRNTLTATWLIFLALSGVALGSMSSDPDSRPSSKLEGESQSLAAQLVAEHSRVGASNALNARVAGGQETQVIITYKDSAVSRTAAAAAGSPTADAITVAAAVPQAARLQAFASLKARTQESAAFRRHGARVDQDFDQLPVSVVTVSSAEALEALRSNADIASVEPVGMKEQMMQQSMPLIAADAAIDRGFLGAGCSVAIIDGGGDFGVSDLGNCSAPGAPSPCRVAFARSFANDGAFTKDAHATNVASTVSQVAPGAKIILLDVFDGTWATDSNIINAINWAIANKDTYSICAINLSLGDKNKNTRMCGGSAYESAFASARRAGIVPAVAAGNNYFTDGLNSPACAPSAVSVGAVHDSNHGYYDMCDRTTYADKTCCFANVANYLDILAPGSVTTAGGISMSGTSMASPHVAGAAAVLKAAYPAASVDQVVTALKQGGKKVQDWYTKMWFARLDVNGALTALSNGLPASGDTTAPIAWVAINGGADITGSTKVTVSISAKDDTSDMSGMQMCISNTAECTTGFVAYASTSSFDLEAADGSKTVYVWLKDQAGNTMAAPATDSITLDTKGPSGTVAINSGATLTTSRTVMAKFSAVGATQMCYTTNGADPATACGGAWRNYVSSLAIYLSAPEGPQTIRVAYRNAWSVVGPVASATIMYDITAPVDPVSFSITPSDVTADMRWDPTTAADPASGVARFIVTYRQGTTLPPVKCTIPKKYVLSASVAPGATTSSVVITGLKAKKAYRFRLCTVDAAGNVSNGVVGSVTTMRRLKIRSLRNLL